MRILTYKRTHIGDPDATGRFGVNSCMGRVRDYAFDAVIGVGGIGAEPRNEGIAEKINWVGIGPSRHAAPGKRANEITFQHFLYLEEEGPNLTTMAPNLAKRLYKQGARFLLNGYSEKELAEALGIIDWSKSQKSSKSAAINNPCQHSSCYSPCEPKKPTRKCGC